MENETFMEKISSQIGQNASIRNIFGEPVQAGEKTIIPVGRIAYGFGGGFGQGNHPKKEGEKANGQEAAHGEGAGGGGGLMARPKGVYEISPAGTRFIAANNYATIIAGVALGFILRGFLTRRHR